REYGRAVTTPTVEISLGKLEGTAGEGVNVFRGVPYAAPPVGPRRFSPPEPAAPWSGARAADAYGPVAPQLPSPLEALMGSRPVTWDEEKCLTLNVWTPGVDAGRRPVMV